MYLVHPLFPWRKNLEVDFSVRGLPLCFEELVSGKVPVGEEGLGISGGEKEAPGFRNFREARRGIRTQGRRGRLVWIRNWEG